MIVRILGDGQYELAENMESEFERLDNHLIAHVEDGDEEAFRRELAELIGIVQQGSEVPDDDFRPSDAVLPSPNASLADVQELLSEEQANP
jgi:Asp-tRNA(Asn)/Glu-tRNA(Gln) amidotransferase C subunit